MEKVITEVHAGMIQIQGRYFLDKSDHLKALILISEVEMYTGSLLTEDLKQKCRDQVRIISAFTSLK